MAVGGFKQPLQCVGVDHRRFAENLPRLRAGPDGIPRLFAGRVVAVDRVPVAFFLEVTRGGRQLTGAAEMPLRNLLRWDSRHQRLAARPVGSVKAAAAGGRHDRRHQDQPGKQASANKHHDAAPLAIPPLAPPFLSTRRTVLSGSYDTTGRLAQACLNCQDVHGHRGGGVRWLARRQERVVACSSATSSMSALRYFTVADGARLK